MFVCFSGLEILQDIQLSSKRKNAFTDVAVEKLLDSNLSAKYALTGQLGEYTRALTGQLGEYRGKTRTLTGELGAI